LWWLWSQVFSSHLPYSLFVMFSIIMFLKSKIFANLVKNYVFLLQFKNWYQWRPCCWWFHYWVLPLSLPKTIKSCQILWRIRHQNLGPLSNKFEQPNVFESTNNVDMSYVFLTNLDLFVWLIFWLLLILIHCALISILYNVVNVTTLITVLVSRAYQSVWFQNNAKKKYFGIAFTIRSYYPPLYMPTMLLQLSANGYLLRKKTREKKN
jgi:hypothetical protein